MVIRCKTFPEEGQDSILNGVTRKEDGNSLLNSIKIKNPSQKDDTKNESQKAAVNERGYKMFTFILNVHSYSYVNKVELFVKQMDGIKSVKGEHNSTSLKVTGRREPSAVREMVEREIKKKVELIFPLADMEGDGGESEGTETQQQRKNRVKTAIADQKIEERTVVLKIRLHCDGCIKKIKRSTSKFKGVHSVSVDKVEDLVTARGNMDTQGLVTYLIKKLNQNVEIFAVKNDTDKKDQDIGGGEKKDEESSTTSSGGKKDRDISCSKKKDKESSTTSSRDRKHKDIGGSDKKDKESSIISDGDKKDKEAIVSGDDGSRDDSKEEGVRDGSEEGDRVANLEFYDGYALPSHQEYMRYRAAQIMRGPQFFSDENPNACSIL